MPIEVRVDEARQLLEIVFEGELTSAELMQTIDRHLREPSATLPLGLFDLSGVTITDITAESVREASQRVVQQVDPYLEEGKVAIVAPRDLFFGMARMYGILRDGSPVEVQVFRDRGEAEAWLGLAKV